MDSVALLLINALTGFGMGWHNAETSALLPRLEADTENLGVNMSASITSFLMMGRIVAAPFSGYMVVRFGFRKATLFYEGAHVLFALLMLVPVTPSSAGALLFYRFFAGMSSVGCPMVKGMWVAEVLPSQHRSKAMVLAPMMMSVGPVCVYALDIMIPEINQSWKLIVAIGCITPMLVWLIVFAELIPEPKINNPYRPVANQEEVVEDPSKEQQPLLTFKSSDSVFTGYKLLVIDKKARLESLIAFLVSSSQFTGISVMVSATRQLLDSPQWAFAFGLSGMVGGLLSYSLVNICSRRTLLLSGYTGVVLCHIAQCFTEPLPSDQFVGPHMIFLAVYHSCIASTCWLLLPEIFTRDQVSRAYGMSMCWFNTAIQQFLITQFLPVIFPSILEVGTISKTFFVLLACSCSLLLAGLAAVLPSDIEKLEIAQVVPPAASGPVSS